ncbi:MAG TPA: condensation domain-containing protein, partial [Anaerolineales bacterium]|nr:condensation domain-containing protein [Anaerolineales bacterium]
MSEETIEAIYPLSPVQLGILFHSNYDQRSSVYAESITFSLHGHLDRQAFKAAWHKVFERHSVLRTFFVWKNRETPLQIVRRDGNLPWQELDWRHMTGEEQHENLHLLLKSDQEQGFDLSKAPAVRLILIRLSEESHQFIWSYHHILLDGWSLSIALDEVFALYRSLCEGWTLSLAHTQPYKAYVTWLSQRDLADSETFWKGKLQGFTKPTSIDADGFFAKSVQNPSGYESRQLRLTQDVSAALRSMAREHQLTLNTLFQGAWALLLSRYSGESDVVFGVAVSGRSVPLTGIESMVGLFIGSMPVRARLSPQMPLIDWLVEFQNEQIQARQFEYSSLRDIQAWSAIDRFQRKPLFDTILSFNNYDFDRVFREKAGGLDIRDVSFREGSHYPLTVLIDPGEEIQIRTHYDRSRFDGGIIQRILAHLEVLLQQMAARPSGSLSSLSLLTAAENQKLLVDYNHTVTLASTEKSVLQLFEEQVRLNPDVVAVQFGDRAFTFGQLNMQVNQLAHHLKKLGIGPEKVVALCMDRSPLVIVAILGILKAGGGYLPLDGTLPSQRLALMLEETRSPLILTTERLAHKLPPSEAAIIRLDIDWASIEAESVDNLPLIAEPED